MSKRISLFGRKRLGELLSGESADPAREKRDELLALKLNEINEEAAAQGDYRELPLSEIVPDPNQPRKTFKNIEALAKSIEANGVLQPIIVSQVEKGFQIIAGERRYQAAKLAGLASMPCLVRKENDANVLLLQLLENDQRDEVSPLEEAEAVARLVEELGVPKSQVAAEIGREPAWVSMRLGLYAAPQEIKALAQEGVIEDLRTLHELKKLMDEQADAARELVERIRNNQVPGSYRQVIAQMRRVQPKGKESKNSKEARPSKAKTIRKMEKSGDQLILHVGGKHPVTFDLPKEVLVKFLAEATFN